MPKQDKQFLSMITNTLTIIVDEYAEAPNYDKDWKMVKIKEAHIVKNSMTSGNASIDLQLEDVDGNKYLVMTSGGLIDMLAAAVRGATS